MLTTNQTAPGLAHWLLWFLPVFVQMVAVLRQIRIVIHGDQQPWLDPFVKISPPLSVQAMGAVKGIRMVWEFGGSTHSVRTSCSHISKTMARVLICMQRGRSLSERGILQRWIQGKYSQHTTWSKGKFWLCHDVPSFFNYLWCFVPQVRGVVLVLHFIQ